MWKIVDHRATTKVLPSLREEQGRSNTYIPKNMSTRQRNTLDPAEMVNVAGLGKPLPAESGPMCASTPVLDAFLVVVERAQFAPLVEHVAPAPAVSVRLLFP